MERISEKDFTDGQQEKKLYHPYLIWGNPIWSLCPTGKVHRESVVSVYPLYAIDDLWRGFRGNRVAGGFPACTAKKIPIPGSRSHRGYRMEHLAPAFMVHSQLITERIQLCSFYPVLYYFGSDFSSGTQDYRKHLGFHFAPRMVQYSFRGNVHPDFAVSVP